VLQDDALCNAPWLLLSGTSLAFHFALWVMGIENTSLTHALLYVSITPILIAAGMWLMRMPLSIGTPVHCLPADV
jgi:drug/metabolite transporter (DMT)-like permease